MQLIYIVAALLYTSFSTSQALSSDSCSTCQDCQTCTQNSNCGWVLSSSGVASCRHLNEQICPPSPTDTWYKSNMCPCTSCAIPELLRICPLRSGQYSIGFHCATGNPACSTDVNFGEGSCGSFSSSCCCQTTEDCGSGQYCLYSMNGPNNSGFCQQFGGVGASCGGYVLPQYQLICQPGLQCVEINPDVGGICQYSPAPQPAPN